MHLLAYDYFSESPDPHVGLSRTATLIKTARAETENALLFDTGDFLQGNLLGDQVAYRDDAADRTHPAIAAMNTLQYDGATLGNHEFSYGVDFLLDTIISARFPLVLANAARELGKWPSSDRTILHPYRILNRQLRGVSGSVTPIRIGLIGFLPPQTAIWDRHLVDGKVQFRDIVETAQDYIPRMKADGADLIIALAHSGIALGDERQQQENAVIPLSRIDGIDVILCGHQHRLFPDSSFLGAPGIDVGKGTINGKPVMMPGFWGSHLGVMDLALARDGDGTWFIRRHRTDLRPVACASPQDGSRETIAEAPEILHAVRHHHRATLDYMQTPVGRTQTPLHSFFALVADDASIQLVARAKADHVEKALAGTPHADLPILSAVASFKAGGRAGPNHYTDISPGPLTLRSLADLYAFPNLACAVRLTGREVLEWLERSVSLFHRITPGLPQQALHDPQFPSYDFDHMIGLEYEIDPSQPARYSAEGMLICPQARRITAATWRGEPLDPDREFIVATNGFRASGGGGFVQVAPEDMALTPDRPIRDILADYIRRHGTIAVEAEPVWRFRALQDTSARFKTSMRAAQRLQDARRRKLSFDQAGDDGFALIRLDF